jgi:hypothetical protein
MVHLIVPIAQSYLLACGRYRHLRHGWRPGSCWLADLPRVSTTGRRLKLWPPARRRPL